jgi:hypothetical protein
MCIKRLGIDLLGKSVEVACMIMYYAREIQKRMSESNP